LFVGQVGTITMTTNTEGGTTGQLRGLAVLTGSTATSMIDPQIFIDPAWLVLHPGYSIVVDESVGNGLAAVGPGPGPGAVPEPGSVVLLLAGVFGAASMARRRREAAA
jgi:hypothetical protein